MRVSLLWCAVLVLMAAPGCDVGGDEACGDDASCPTRTVCRSGVCVPDDGDGEGEGEDEGEPLRAAAIAAQVVDEDQALRLTLVAEGGDGTSIIWAMTAPTVPGAAVSLVGDQLSFQAPPDVSGVIETLTLTPSQGGVAGEPTTLSITIVPVNDPPSFLPVDVSIDEDVAVDFDDGVFVAAQISAGPFENGAVHFEVEVLEGAVLLDGPPVVDDAGRLRLGPAADAWGTVTLLVTPIETIDDDTVAGAPLVVTMTIRPINDPPSVTTIALFTQEDVPLQAAVADSISGGPFEPEAVTITVALPPEQRIIAAMTPLAHAAFDVQLQPDANGSVTFEVIATDEAGLQTRQTTTLVVTPRNDPPRFTSAGASIPEDGVVEGTSVITGLAPGPDNETGIVRVAIVAVTGAAVFSVPPTISPTGALIGGTLLPHANGTALLEVEATDPEGATFGALVPLVVTAVNDPAVIAAPRSMATPIGVPNTFAISISDIDGAVASVVASPQPPFATIDVTSSPPHQLTITPVDATATGRSTVTLTVTDVLGGATTQTVSVAVLPRQQSCFHYRAQNASIGDAVYPLLQPRDDTNGCRTTDPSFDVVLDGCVYGAFCDMADGDPGEDGGGWTLVMKVDGGDNGFDYDDARWTDDQVGPPASGDDPLIRAGATAALVVDNDLKLRAFLHVKVDELRVGFAPRIGGSTAFSFVKRRLAEPVEYNLLAGGLESARQLFTPTGERLLTSPGRDEWLEVNPEFSLQANCNRAGINVRGGGGLLPRVRVGILGNDVNDCSNPDSYIGVGAAGDNANVAGNRVFPFGATDRSIPLFSALLVRSNDLTDVGSFTTCGQVLAAGFVDSGALYAVNGVPTSCAP